MQKEWRKEIKEIKSLLKTRPERVSRSVMSDSL